VRALAKPEDSCYASKLTSLHLAASDPNGLSMNYAVSGLPAGLGMDGVTGIISGAISYGAAQVNGGRYSVTATVTDQVGASAIQTFTWTIAHTNRPPTLFLHGAMWRATMPANVAGCQVHPFSNRRLKHGEQEKVLQKSREQEKGAMRNLKVTDKSARSVKGGAKALKFVPD
jgi:hypothetical protein